MKIKASRGFTLLEVMIALVIFSIGLLGLAGLQARGLNSNTSAQFRTLAAIEAYGMADRMRANPLGVKAGNYDNLDNTTPPAGPNCLIATCSEAQIAQSDYYEWINNLQNLLPSGHGSVIRIAGTDQFILTIFWDDERTGATGKACGDNPSIDLKCYRLVFEP